MSSARVLVTGGTGFIGGRLVEQLVLGQGAEVRCLVRDFSRAARLARFPLELRPGGLGDLEALAAAVDGVEVVYHCAYDYGSAEVNSAAAEALVAACAAQGVRRLVFLSSMAVYQPLPDGEFDETARSEPSGQDYSDSKLATERTLLAAAVRAGTPAVVLQPTTVYGPYCLAWTIGAARQLRSGYLVLPAHHLGWCNPVYVDDVVQAMLLAADREAAIGERFLVSGPAPISWRDYYAGYDEALGTGSLVFMEDHELAAGLGHTLGANARRFRANPKRLLEIPLVRRTYDTVRRWTGQGMWDKVKDHLPRPYHLPDEGLLALYRSKGIARIDKARAGLGYEPRFDFARGLALTCEWLRWANL